MSTAKWQNIAGSKKFFTQTPISYFATLLSKKIISAKVPIALIKIWLQNGSLLRECFWRKKAKQRRCSTRGVTVVKKMGQKKSSDKIK